MNEKGELFITVNTTGHEKAHFICVLDYTASGKNLPSMVIFRCITMPKEIFLKEYQSESQ